MYRETDAATAFTMARLGGKGIVVFEDGETKPMAEAFKQFDRMRFVVDFDEGQEKAVAVPKAETPEAPRKRRTQEELKAAIIKAYDGGNRTITEVMNMTGCTYATVKRYIEKG